MLAVLRRSAGLQTDHGRRARYVALNIDAAARQQDQAKQQHREHHGYREGSPVSDRSADANHFDQLSLRPVNAKPAEPLSTPLRAQSNCACGLMADSPRANANYAGGVAIRLFDARHNQDVAKASKKADSQVLPYVE
jgi:hypothetical protein